MKKQNRIVSILLLTVMVIMLAVPVSAADWEYTFNGTVGNTEYFIITSNAYDEIQEAKIYNGVIPGMELDVAGGVTLGLAGVPTTEGEFKVFITLKTRDLGTVDIKVTVNISPAQAPVSSGIPVITKHPTGETVVEGESATFIARADNVRQYIWEIGMGDASMTCEEFIDYYGKGIKITGYNTEKLVISNIPKDLDGVYVWCRFVGAEASDSSNAAQIKVIAQKDATPVVTKDPTDETVQEGGEAVFVAKAKYAQHYMWQLISPDGVIYDCSTVNLSFPALKVSGATTERITLSNIPLELNGYKIQCMFTAGDTVVSKQANLHVTAKPTEPPTEVPTEVPTEKPTEAPAETVTEKPQDNTPTEGTTPKTKADKKTTDKSDNTLLIVIVISTAAVVIAGIAGLTVLKLKCPKQE